VQSERLAAGGKRDVIAAAGGAGIGGGVQSEKFKGELAAAPLLMPDGKWRMAEGRTRQTVDRRQ
jgi:hypothetical protein